MRPLIEALCSAECAGRAPASPGSARARELILDAMKAAGLEPQIQNVPGSGGANVLATLPGRIDRWVLVGAHYDHLGSHRGQTFHGADDNAAAVAILIEVGKTLVAKKPDGRGVILAAFDAEEPPHFLSNSMGSQHYVNEPLVPLDQTDLMICMDLVGHAVGPDEAPDDVRKTVFALGAERSAGTGSLVDSIARAEPGVVVRRADAEVIPPLSDYFAFWHRKVPFLFLTNGRWRHYHTPEDTPEKLDYPKIAATARWLERFVRASCERAEHRFTFVDQRDDASTLRSLIALTAVLTRLSPLAQQAHDAAQALLARCDAQGALPSDDHQHALMLVGMIESGLA